MLSCIARIDSDNKGLGVVYNVAVSHQGNILVPIETELACCLWLMLCVLCALCKQQEQN